MATRGHVQDPNDRRLRPIYGELLEPASWPGWPAEAYPAPGRRPRRASGAVRGAERRGGGPRAALGRSLGLALGAGLALLVPEAATAGACSCQAARVAPFRGDQR